MQTMNINQLPADIKEQVLECLTAYPVAYVTRENGEFTYTAGLCLDTRVKASDFKTFEFKNTDFYTKEQINEFNKALPALW